MPKKIVAVGFSYPSDEVEEIDLESDRSLSDADIILFEPGIPHRDPLGTFEGKPKLGEWSSFRAQECLSHWRSELRIAFDAGKLIVVFLRKPDEVFVYTGDKRESGTGKNAKTTRYVASLNSYSALPVSLTFTKGHGESIKAVGDLRYLAPYWETFRTCSHYECYIEGSVSERLLSTRDGSRIVGGAFRKGSGGLLLLPVLDFDAAGPDSRSETEDEEDDDDELDGLDDDEEWSESAVALGRRLLAILSATVDSLKSETEVTPPPDWSTTPAFRLAGERHMEVAILEAQSGIEALQAKKSELERELKEAAVPRMLLYERGKQLERAVLIALRSFGFTATGFDDGDSEFDAIFESPEGRLLGEVEGKDNKAINIDKITQLERNIQEDFAKDGVNEHAKGVLFANAFRLQPLESRPDYFTEKCRKSAIRLGVALVRTPDMFPSTKYLLENTDPSYATLCRAAILGARGGVASFPSPPIDDVSEIAKVDESSSEEPK